MANPSFAERWAETERELGSGAFATKMVEHGGLVLPEEAAPFLSFDRLAKQPRIWEVFGVPEHWPPDARKPLASYRMIGSDGEGNPICIDEATGAVWWLNHEVNFSGKMLFNSTIPQLAECLLAYMIAFRKEKDPERFRSAVAAIDPPAMAEGTFWAMAAEWIGAE